MDSDSVDLTDIFSVPDDIDSFVSEFDDSSQGRPTVNYLSNVDYSLNSPLIQDELIEYRRFLLGEPHRSSWNRIVWEKRRIILQFLNIRLFDIQPVANVHSWFGTKNLDADVHVDFFRHLIDKSQTDAEATYPILQAFLKGWLGKILPIPNKQNCPINILKWGAYFLDLHIVTLILNAHYASERDELINIPNVKPLSRKYEDVFVYTSQNFGKIFIIYGFVLFANYLILLDRNTVLMMKDTYIARFHTLFSMINRVDSKFAPADWRTINDIYRIGDLMLVENGNRAYEAIKLVEPICSLRMSELAREFRPLIPKFSNYENHITTSIEELEITHRSILILKNKIMEISNHDLVLTIFGSFRHWGHPYLDYIAGLQNVYNQVTMEKNIDNHYAEMLGSDLAYIVLQRKFKETKRWYVDKLLIGKKHPMRMHITKNTWPTPKQIQDFGPNWHKLPLIQCFEIPDLIDPAVIYSDKSHSMNKTEVLNWIRSHPTSAVPSKKVLSSFLEKKETNWKEFLKEVDEVGLKEEDLIIGLKGKERELNIKGRFFSLMSWRLREYFVVTEYLIKSFFVPLFQGLTMADDLTTVTKKLMNNTSGQGNDDYSNICIANHLDYTKWNNHQRHRSNQHVFKVMGQFLGYPNLIFRTHEFFQKSLIYYGDRPDLMFVNGNLLQNKHGNLVTWQGQEGGLEGLRQKGWSITNLLVIRRESNYRNTKVGLLAQGDNQVICTQYKLQKFRSQEDLIDNLRSIHLNNQTIMDAIEVGTKKLGLVINRDETLQSADYLVYGKVPIYRGCLKCLETKRWSRVTCVTNDQLPTLANTLSTISSNALTVAHFSTSPLNAMVHYHYLANFGNNLISFYNPAIKGKVNNKIKNVSLNSREYKALILYLDPCLGGSSGMSLTRFLIRSFPDPLTESLVFWKTVAENGPAWVKQLAIHAGNPKLNKIDSAAFQKLLEDPLSLNLIGGISALTVIKEEIKRGLLNNLSSINNQVVRTSLAYFVNQEPILIEYLRSIKPLFPRFLSEYISGTYIGIVRSLIGLFQNSKTIRTTFSRNIDQNIKSIIRDGEIHTILALCKRSKTSSGIEIWSCSSSKADELRWLSWGEKVFGATIPHPLELIGQSERQPSGCLGCGQEPPRSYYISTLVPQGLINYELHRGPYKAYLGSKTSETTSILQPWERETRIPLLKRAVKLRSAIGWFIDKDSNLGRSIIQNLTALTGEDWSQQLEGCNRTGSALHRFSCSRQSTAGYSAQSPSKLSWMFSTTDTLSILNTYNHDFMYQTILIFVQATVSELMDGDKNQGYFHNHIKCKSCLREIQEITLESRLIFKHPDVSDRLASWKPDTSEWSTRKEIISIPEGNWNKLSPLEMSFHIGRAEGFIFGDLTLSCSSLADASSLFPLSLQGRIVPRDYLEGILDGLIRASSVHCISRRSVSDLIKPKEALLGVGLHLIDNLSENPSMLSLWRANEFNNLFFKTPHKIPASYPTSNRDVGSMGRSYLRTLYKNNYVKDIKYFNKNFIIWIFSDTNDNRIAGLMYISGEIVRLLYTGKINKHTKGKLKSLKDRVILFKDPKLSPDLKGFTHKNMLRTDSEIRHASKFIYIDNEAEIPDPNIWEAELSSDIYTFNIPYGSKALVLRDNLDITIPKIRNPLIAGLRLFQFASGAHYKIRSILYNLNITYQDAICGGDGSGGIGAYLLRANYHTRLIFNSLLSLEDVDLRGAMPSPPAAIDSLGQIKKRCVNLADAWENPSDLSEERTWEYFLMLERSYRLNIDIIILDMECQNDDISDKIERNVANYCFKLMEDESTLIYKTYLHRILSKRSVLLKEVGSQFRDVKVVYSNFSSSQTSEVYVIMQGRSKHHVPTYPDLTEICNNLSKFPVFRSTESEFDRGVEITYLNMFLGVPKQFISDPYIDGCIYLESLGVKTGIAAVLAEMARISERKDKGLMATLTFFVSLNSLLNLTSFENRSPGPPPDAVVSRVGVLIIVYLNWLSVTLKDYDYHLRAQTYITKAFQFSWKTFKLKKKGQQTKRKPLFGNKYSFLGKYEKYKNLFMDAELAKIGQGIRIFCRMFDTVKFKTKADELSKMMREFNDGLTCQSLFFFTDLQEVLELKW